jgi:SnoaL-like domain
MSQANVEIMRAAIEAFNRRDGEGFGAFLANDAEIVPVRAALEGTVNRGPDAAAQYCAAVDESWEDLRWEVEEVIRTVGVGFSPWGVFEAGVVGAVQSSMREARGWPASVTGWSQTSARTPTVAKPSKRWAWRGRRCRRKTWTRSSGSMTPGEGMASA